MATHFSILAWRNPWTEGSVILQGSMGSQSQATERLSTHHMSVCGTLLSNSFIKNKQKPLNGIQAKHLG